MVIDQVEFGHTSEADLADPSEAVLAGRTFEAVLADRTSVAVLADRTFEAVLANRTFEAVLVAGSTAGSVSWLHPVAVKGVLHVMKCKQGLPVQHKACKHASSTDRIQFRLQGQSEKELL